MSEAKATANEKWVGDMMDLLKERDSLLARNKKLAEALEAVVNSLARSDEEWASVEVYRNCSLSFQRAKKALAENKEQADEP